MNKVKIGILREGKIPVDRRVILNPDQCLRILKEFPQVELLIQPSDVRCISNKEYADKGLVLQEDLSNCDILLGIKEVPIHQLIAHKTYLFFSHTIKKQPHNKRLFQEIANKKITLIDYEALKNEEGNRVIAFGRFAGIVGAYNTLKLLGKKTGAFQLKPAYECFDMQELKLELKKVRLSHLKLVVTGAGRVGRGVEEVLNAIGMKSVSANDFINKTFSEAVYTQLSSKDYHRKKDGTPFNANEFYVQPSLYESRFTPFFQTADVLIAAAYWNTEAPLMFTKEDMKRSDFNIRFIGDITCDVDGSIPATVKTTNIYDPAYDYNPYTEVLEAPFSDSRNITVMAIDNLPCELPRDASFDFGNQFIQNVLPQLLVHPYGSMIQKCMVLDAGQLNPPFNYLEDYLNS
jgi:saccharopine dehydrogenase (NAD+, L-lysine-forming)